jgi:hypothetical protein
VASWAVLQEQTVWISPRATSFSVVCDACAELAAGDGYGAAVVHGNMALDELRGTVECPRGHRLRIEREGR